MLLHYLISLHVFALGEKDRVVCVVLHENEPTISNYASFNYGYNRRFVAFLARNECRWKIYITYVCILNIILKFTVGIILRFK